MAQHARDLQLARFRRAIRRTTRVSGARCERTDVEDARAIVVRQQGQGGARHAEDAEDIGLEHRLPVCVLAVGHGIHAVGAAGVVDENVELAGCGVSPADLFLRPRKKSFHARGAGHVQFVKVRLRCARLFRGGGNFFQPVHAPRAEQ